MIGSRAAAPAGPAAPAAAPAAASELAPSWDAWLGVVRARLSGPLLDHRALARLGALARQLPGDCLGILEIHLGSRPRAVDFSLRLAKPSQALCFPQWALPSHVRSFLDRWSEGGDLRPVSSVWLELDLDRPDPGLNATTLPDPVVCAKLPPEADPSWLAGTLLPALQGGPLPPAQRDLFLACLRRLPPAASLLYVFSLLARGSRAIRMEVFGLDALAAVEYLRALAPAPAGRLAGLAPVFAGVERIHLSFELDDEVLPRVGLEGSYPRLPRREPRWRELFDRLVARGLCSPEEREALLAWPGYDTFWTAPEAWPLAEAGVAGICARFLSHVKVVSPPEGKPRAKAYLAVEPLRSRPGG